MAWDPAALYLLACKSQLRCADHGFPLQAGAITGGVAAFAEGPIDFYKSQIQVQIIRSKSDPNYKREAAGMQRTLCNTCRVWWEPGASKHGTAVTG